MDAIIAVINLGFAAAQAEASSRRGSAGMLLATVRFYRDFLRPEPTTRAEFLTAMFEEGSYRDRSGTDVWGGSLDLTSDYLVRGISRSDDHAALQLDLHLLDSSGFAAGVFASNTQIDTGARRDAELSAYLGYVWSEGDAWHGKILAANYSYPWSQAGSLYNYDEIDLEVAYQDWVRVALSLYPVVRRYSYDGDIIGVTAESAESAESAELSLQRPIFGRLSATAGIGYYQQNGAGGSGYAYWSAGAAYDWGPVSLVVSYVGASSAANALFYNAAVGGRWSGTAIWRF
jgi:uncharacterized protein (TIGR02001 family)